jgi:hypothetical protein
MGGNAVGTLRDQTIITLLLHTGLRAQELCTLTRQQVHLGKRNGILRIVGKRKKVREVPLNTTARSSPNHYLETLSPVYHYLFPSEKTQKALTGRALGHLVAKYATQAQVTDLSHRFGYRMAEVVPLHRLAQIMGHDSLDTTMLYVRGTKQIYSRIWRRSRGHKEGKRDKEGYKGFRHAPALRHYWNKGVEVVASCPLCTCHVVGVRHQSGPSPSLWAQPKTRLQRRFPSGESRDEAGT